MIQIRVGFCWAAGAMFVFAACTGCGLIGNADTTSTSVQFYTVPVVCELNEDGQFVESTGVILHNPEAGQADIYRRAVLVVLEDGPTPPQVAWDLQQLGAGQAVRLDCDTFARVLTRNPATTFADQFEEGERVDGFLTLGIESVSDIPRLDAIVRHTSVDNDGDETITNQPIEPIQVTVTDWPP